MKNLKYILFIFLLSGITETTLYAQDEEQNNVYTVTTTQFIFPDDGSIAEWDSLNALYMDNVINKNEFIISQRALRHMWGHNSEDLVYITEYKSFTDIEKGQARNTELFNEAWATSEERQAYNKAASKYFGDHHSDEIYQEVTNQRK